MIVDWWLDLMEALTGWLAGLLPDDDVFGGQSLGFQIFGGLNYFFPLSELASVVLGIIALGLPLAIVSVVVWLLVGVLRGGSAKA